MQPIEVNLELALLATLATVLMIGLGFLRNPSPATRLWALAFMVVMLGTFGLIAAESAGLLPLRAACMAVILTGPALLWAGVRAKFAKQSLAWLALVQGAGSIALLVPLSDTPSYMLGFRIVFAGASVFAAMTAAELVSGTRREWGMLLPLIIASSIFPMLALASLILTVRALTDAEPDTQTTTVNVLAMMVYLVCAIVSLLHLAGTEHSGAQRSARRPAVRSLDALRERLVRAAAMHETSWVLLYIELDDVVDLRLAVGESAFQQVAARFSADVYAVFPTEADVVFLRDTTAVLLLTRPDGTVRANVRSLLNAVATLQSDQPLAVQMSASVGWASTGVTGYDVDDLLAAASHAAVDARLEGGDRWVRVESPPVAAR